MSYASSGNKQIGDKYTTGGNGVTGRTTSGGRQGEVRGGVSPQFSPLSDIKPGSHERAGKGRQMRSVGYHRADGEGAATSGHGY